MKGYEDIADTIEAYVARRLSKQESEAFEQRMLRDEGLKQAVSMEQSLSSIILENDLLQLNKKMAVELASLEKKATTKRIYISILALVTLSAGMYYFFSPRKIEDDPISAKKEVPQKTDHVLSVESTKEKFENEAVIPKISTSSVETEQKPLNTNVTTASELQVVLPVETDAKVIAPPLEGSESVSKAAMLESVVDTPCTDKKREATFISKACQKNHSNGSIEIRLPSSPHKIQYSLDKQHFTSSPQFKQLNAGEHTVYVKDDDCVTSLGKVIVKSTSCVSEYEKTYSPDLDMAWPIPIMEGEAASFKIVDKTGNVAFESSGFEPSGVTWSGNTSHSGPAALGVYKVFIHYPSGESCVSSVTLFR